MPDWYNLFVPDTAVFYSVMLMQLSDFLIYWCLYVLWDLMLVQQQREEIYV